MSWFFIGLGAGLVVAALVALAVYLARARGLARRGQTEPEGYRKVLVATVNQPFYQEALLVAAGMIGEGGIVETIYLVEIPLNRPLESEAGEEVAAGMLALEEAAAICSSAGVRPLPRLERTRMGSKTVVEMQREEGFDAVVLDIHPGKRTERVGRRIEEYVQDHATCPVVVVSKLEQ